MSAGTVLDFALDYAARGWHVFPLGPQKAPVALCPACRTGCPGRDACTCGRDTCHSFYKATTNPEQLEEWFGQRRYPGIGIRCGAPSGIVALDIDGHAGGTKALGALERHHGVLPGTLLHCSGSGTSVHMVYAHPGHKVAPSAGKLGTGLDVRGDGSYIVAAPTVHPKTGVPYFWHGGDFTSDPAPWPGLLDDLLTPAAPVTRREFGQPRRFTTVSRVAAILEFVLGAQPGQRNSALHWASCRFAEVIADGQSGEAEALNALLAAAQAIGLSNAEAEPTIKSGLNAPARGVAA